MFIVLEGVDGAGKSTLARALSYRCNGEVRHFGAPKSHPLSEYGLLVEGYRPNERNVICDRFHIGEMIYAELYRNGSLLGDAGYWWMQQLLRSRGALVVHVTAPLPLIEARLERRGETFLRPEHVRRVHEEFAQRTADALTVTSPVDEVDLAEILVLARVHEWIVTPLTPFPHYVGPILPRLLLVGDTPNQDNTKYPLHSTVFAPYPGSSGRYLIEQVVLPSTDPNAIGLVNAYHHNDTPINLAGLWSALGQPEVVALGRKAEHLLSLLEVPHRAVPHPQYVRRFHYHEAGEYREDILAGLS